MKPDQRLGLETILGAFVAGAILNMVDRDSMSHPNFRLKVGAIGYGFVAPVFFISSGLRFDLQALLDSPSSALKLPMFLMALLAVRGVPAAFYATEIGRRGALVSAGLVSVIVFPPAALAVLRRESRDLEPVT